MRLEDHRRAAREAGAQNTGAGRIAKGAEGEGETPVTDDLTARLAELEEIVEEGLETFIAVGEALREIRDSRLYRKQHKTFEDYCRARWGWDRRNANRHIEAAKIAQSLGSIDPAGARVPGVQNVGQARAISPLYKEDESKAAELMRRLRAEHGEDLTAAKIEQAVSRELQVRSAAGCEVPMANAVEEAGPPEIFIVRGGDLPLEPEMLSAALGEGKAAALALEVLAAGKKNQLAGVKGFLDAVARDAREAGRNSHLLVLCSPDPERLRKAERAMQRRAPRAIGTGDPVARVLPLLSRSLARQGSSSFFDHMPRSGGIVVARTRPADAGADGEARLVLIRAGLRISVPVREEVVADLTEMVVVDDVEDRYRRAAEAGAVRFGVQELPGGDRDIEDGRPRNLSLILDGGVEGGGQGPQGSPLGARRYELPAVTVAGGGRDTEDGLGVEYDPPRPADAEEEAVYEAGALRSALERVAPYASEDDARPVLTSVYFEPGGGGGGGMRLVATDSYRLIHDDSLASPGGLAPGSLARPFLSEPQAILRGDVRLLLEILKKAEPGTQVSIMRVGFYVLVCGELAGGADFQLVCRPAAGDYPNYRNFLPPLDKLARFGLPRREALEAVKAAAELAESGPVVTPVRVEIHPEGTSATISLRSEAGTFSASMEARGPNSGDAVVRRAAFNPSFFARAMRSLEAQGEETAWLWVNQTEGVDAAGAVVTKSLKPSLFGANADILVMPMHEDTGG